MFWSRRVFFQISLRYKLFVYFFALTFFAVCFSFVLNYTRTLEILKKKSAVLYQTELSSELKSLSLDFADTESIKQSLKKKEQINGAYFLLDRSGNELLGNPKRQLRPEQFQEMLRLERGSFLRLKTDAVMVFERVPGQNLILGKIHSWSELQKDIKNIRFLTACFVGLIVIISALFAFFASEEMFSSLKAIVAETKLVAERNFQERSFPLSDDEMNELSLSFLQMRTRLKNYIQHSDQLIKKIESTVLELDSTTHLLSEVAHEQAKGASHQASSLEEVYRMLGRLSESARQLTEKSREIENSARRTSSAYHSGEKVLSDAIGSVRLGQSQVEKIQEIMRMLESQSIKIREIVGIIEEIADQNNLLALNALIEARVSGEAGQRFSVVANEMKRLAVMTQEFNATIGKVIKEALGAINTATKATLEGNELMGKSASLANEAGEAFQGLSSLIDLNLSASEEIVRAMTMQILTNDEIAKALSDVRVVAQQLSSRTQQIQQSIERLINLGAELKTLTSQKPQ